jgi:hypothetical protein
LKTKKLVFFEKNIYLFVCFLGTGCGPLLDFYLHVTANNIELRNPVIVYFTTNSIGLFQFVTDLICGKAIPNYSVNAHLTRFDFSFFGGEKFCLKF